MKESIKSLIDSKKEYTSKLVSILKKCLYKFIIDIFLDVKTEKQNLLEFQKRLYSIPSWSSNRKQKEYKYCLKYLSKKHQLSENELSQLLEKVLVLHIKTLSSQTSQLEIQLPTLKEFWYLCLKLTGKYFYEHPKDMRNLTDLETTHSKLLENVIHICLNKYLPITKMFNEDSDSKLKYNFNNVIEDTNTEEEGRVTQDNQETTVHSENSLRYISSEQFENEYYQPDIQSEPDDSKQINFLNNKKGKKGNEIEEKIF
jgi:hypothetical protein